MIRRIFISIIAVIVAVLVVLIVLDIQPIIIGTRAFLNAFFVPSGRNPVQNGSFEMGDPSDNPPGIIIQQHHVKRLCGGSSVLANWQIFRHGAVHQNCDDPQLGGAFDAICWALEADDFFTEGKITAQAGDRFVDLTGFLGRPPGQYGELKQEIEGTEPGTTYELSFWIGTSNKLPPQPPGSDTAFYEVGVNVVGVPNGQAAFRVGSAREISQWEQKRLRFRAKDPTTTIIFDAFGSSPPNGNGGDYLGLDNVELRKLCFIFDIGCRF